MRRILLVLLFLFCFFTSLFAFMPYKKLYNAAIERLATTHGVDISYEMSRASPLHLYLKKIKIITNNRVIELQECKIKLTPLSYISSGTLAKIILKASSNEGDFIVKKADSGWLISGMFQTALISNFLSGNEANFIRGLKGTDSLQIKLSPAKDSLKIDELKVTGDFELVAHGYIKNGKVRLMGVIKIGNIKENFSI